MTINSIDYCYHTHTYRCGHAFGEDEEYVINAIKNGYKELGFTDHAMLPSIYQPGIRGDFHLLNDYINSVNSLKEKYKNQINIYLGMECEYFDRFKDFYSSLLKERGFDYLILGQHCIFDEHNSAIWYASFSKKEALSRYTEDIIKGINSGLFKIVAHPDVFMTYYDKWDSFAIKCSKRIIDAAEKKHVALELNLGCANSSNEKRVIDGVESYCYPFDKFWSLVEGHNVSVFIDADAHTPRVFNNTHEEVALEIANKYHLKLVNRLDLYNKKHTI